jgi:hypothetical protein
MRTIASAVRGFAAGVVACLCVAQTEALAASSLGNEPHPVVVATDQYRNACDWNTLDWAQLTPQEQSAWTTLGWSESIWDNNQSPASSDMSWDELSPVQKQAAQSLGFSGDSWDHDPC